MFSASILGVTFAFRSATPKGWTSSTNSQNSFSCARVAARSRRIRSRSSSLNQMTGVTTSPEPSVCASRSLEVAPRGLHQHLPDLVLGDTPVPQHGQHVLAD